MKRIIMVTAVVLSATVVGAPNGATASQSEKTIVVRVKADTPSTPVRFSGWYQSDESETPVRVENQSAPFGIKLKTNSVKAEFRKESGDAELFVEAVKFVGASERGNIHCTGNAIRLDIQSDGEKDQMSARILDK